MGFFCGTVGALTLTHPTHLSHLYRRAGKRSAPAAYRMTIFESNLPSHRALLTQMLRVETQMLFNKRGDKIIAVVVTRLHTQR